MQLDAKELYFFVYYMLNQLAIRVRLKGRRYIIEAIQLYFREGIALENLCKEVANRNNQKTTLVRNNIKRCIEQAVKNKSILVPYIIEENKIMGEIVPRFFEGMIEFINTYRVEEGEDITGRYYFNYVSKIDNAVIKII